MVHMVEGGGGYQRRDGCPNARHLFEPNYVNVWTQKFGQRLSMACGVDFVLFKPLYVKIAFIAMFLIFRHMSHSNWVLKRPLKTACYFLRISVSLHDKVLGLIDLDRYQYSLQGMSTSGGSRMWPRGGRGAPLPPKGRFEKLGAKCLIRGTS